MLLSRDAVTLKLTLEMHGQVCYLFVCYLLSFEDKNPLTFVTNKITFFFNRADSQGDLLVYRSTNIKISGRVKKMS